eukprot:GFYU01000600.1.p2 GENE.GFYU01000600.1~~GFYU01000600.1.p2  ORF type:complete len:149 (+),score=31.16 GFYU01000600.1:342-788(+)
MQTVTVSEQQPVKSDDPAVKPEPVKLDDAPVVIGSNFPVIDMALAKNVGLQMTVGARKVVKDAGKFLTRWKDEWREGDEKYHLVYVVPHGHDLAVTNTLAEKNSSAGSQEGVATNVEEGALSTDKPNNNPTLGELVEVYVVQTPSNWP